MIVRKSLVDECKGTHPVRSMTAWTGLMAPGV